MSAGTPTTPSTTRPAGEPVVFSTTEVDERGCTNPKFWEPSEVYCTNVLGGEPNLRQIGAGPAWPLRANDPDSVIRRLPYSGRPPQDVGCRNGRGRTAGRSDRLPRGDDVYIDYAGPPGTMPRGPLLEGVLQPLPEGDVPRQDRRGRACRRRRFRTSTRPPSAARTSCQEPRSRPTRSRRSQARLPPARRTRALEPDGDHRPGALAPLASLRFSPLRVAVGGPRCSASLYAVRPRSRSTRHRAGVAYPLLGLVVSEVGSLGVVYFTETRERRRLQDDLRPLRPRGRRRPGHRPGRGGPAPRRRRLESTVLFCDLRGFTSFAESLRRGDHRRAQPLPHRDELRDPRPRRHARRLHGRRDHGRVRRAARAARPRGPRGGGRQGDARRPPAGVQRVARGERDAERLSHGHRPEHRPGDVRQRRLGAPAWSTRRSATPPTRRRGSRA